MARRRGRRREARTVWKAAYLDESDVGSGNNTISIAQPGEIIGATDLTNYGRVTLIRTFLSGSFAPDEGNPALLWRFRTQTTASEAQVTVTAPGSLQTSDPWASDEIIVGGVGTGTLQTPYNWHAESKAKRALDEDRQLILDTTRVVGTANINIVIRMLFKVYA